MLPTQGDLYTGVAEVARALSSPARLRALNLLFQGSKSIDALAELLGESHANTAAHLKVLRAAGLIHARRQGKHVYQEVSDPETLRLFMALRDTAERCHSATRLHTEAERQAACRVKPDELVQLMASRKALVIDLRPAAEYAAGHIPGARSLPLDALLERAAALPTKQRVMAYCRGKYCAGASQGVALLREAGLRAERLAFGMPEWRALGLPVVQGEAA